MARVRIITGTQRSDRESRIDAALREHFGHATLILPHRHYAAQRKETFFAAPEVKGAWGYRPITTFDQYIRELFTQNEVTVRPLQPGERRLIIEQAISMAGGMGALGAIESAAHTDGFASHLGEIIRLLKQAFVDPEAFDDISRRDDAHPFDGTVSAIYSCYDGLLKDKHAYDPDGLYWMAHELLKQPTVHGLQPHVLFDGFDEFTGAQLRVIEDLDQRVESLTIGLVMDDQSKARDRQAIVLDTRKKLQARFAAMEILSADENDPCTVAAFAASEVFWRDTPTLGEALTKNLEFLPQATSLDEVETVARRVKAQLRQGIPADAIAVITRDAAAYANTWRAVCQSFGIPTHIAQPAPLRESAVAKFLLALIDTLEHWERDAVTELLTSTWFPHSAADPQETYPVLARAAGIISGRRDWHSRITRLEESINEVREKSLPSASDWSRAASALVTSVEQLAHAEKIVPPSASRIKYAHGLLALIDSWELQERAEQSDDMWYDESACVVALRRLFDRIASDTTEAEAIPRAEFLRYLRRVLSEVTVRVEAQYGVLFAELDHIRHCRFDHVYLIGAVEGVLPKPPRANAIYADADFVRMQRHDIAMRPPTHRIDFEMLLFARALETATASLCISWPTLSPGGSALLPSPYVRELEEWTTELGVADKPEAPRFAQTLAQPQSAASAQDLLRSAAASKAMEHAQFVEGASPVAAGIAIEEARGAIAPFGPYDGVIQEEIHVAEIAQHFDSDHLFSVSQLESYVSCPFRFFQDRVLNIREVELPEEKFDPRLSGLIMHRALEDFHRHYSGRSIADIDAAGELPDARAYMAERLDEAFAKVVYPSLPVADGAAALERRRLATRLDRYLLQEVEADDGAWKPSAYEVGFGTRDEEGNPDNLGPFSIEIEGETLRFAGKIDRIDEGDEGWRIVDYKSTIHWKQSDFDEGKGIQLGLYALAFEQHIADGSDCVDAVFLPVGRGKKMSAIFYNGKQNRRVEREAVVRASIAEAVRAIRAGTFHPPVADHKCFGCSERRACRFDAARIARKAIGEGDA